MHYSCGPVDRQAQQAATFHHLKGKQFPESLNLHSSQTVVVKLPKKSLIKVLAKYYKNSYPNNSVIYHNFILSNKKINA